MAQIENCSVCRGKGYIRCPICDGSGKIRKEPSSLGKNVFRIGEELEVCQTCQGTGRRLCKICDGAGKIVIEKSGSTGFRTFSQDN